MERPREVHRGRLTRLPGTNKTRGEQPVRVIERDGDERERAPATIALPIDRHQTVGVCCAFPPVEAVSPGPRLRACRHLSPSGGADATPLQPPSS